MIPHREQHEENQLQQKNQLAREQKEAAHDDVRMSTWCDDDTEQRAESSPQ